MGVKSTWVRAVVACSIVLGTVAVHGDARAQDCGPYGCSPSTLQPGTLPDPTCSLSSTEVQAGAAMTATAGNVPIGTTVELLVGGESVGSQTATTPSADDPTVADLTFSFNAPMAAGTYQVVVAGPAYQAVCSASGLEVLGAQQIQAPDRRSSGGGVGSGVLALTGVEIGLLLAAAVVLVVLGRLARAEAQRRRRTVNQLPLPPTADPARFGR